ncbi:MAG: hypothetical protein JWM14_2657 [Chitinophagaceae bacterium]|nr:hypothetical protein [Chitinophagaceae bacterium]
MLSFLKNHPFAVEAFFESSQVLTFAVPKNQLQQMIPSCLELDLLHDEWAFLAVAMVQTKDLRPKGFPRFTGNDFFLVGYRIFVKYIDQQGKRKRGLYIIKSETDKKKMEYLGNIFTHYQYTTTDISLWREKEMLTIQSKRSDFEVEIEETKEEIALPLDSPFKDWVEARKFAGPLPYTFTYMPEKREMLIIEGVRQDWKPQPIKVKDYRFSFLSSLGLKDVVLANAFIIKNIPYYWKKGKIEKWNR